MSGTDAIPDIPDYCKHFMSLSCSDEVGLLVI